MTRSAIKKSLGLILVLVLIVSLIPVVGAMAAKESFIVSNVAITGIDKPVAGDIPDYTGTEGSDYYSIVDKNGNGFSHGVCWEEYDADWEWQKTMDPRTAFRAGYIYVLYVNVEPISGMHFTSSTTATINGVSANTNGLASSGYIYIAFDPCEEGIKTVDLTVVAPAEGKTPTFAKVNTTTYQSKNVDPKPVNQTNGCIWSNTATGTNLSVSNAFKADTDYTVTYTLFPKDGYAFNKNVTATINGKTATVIQRDGYLLVTLSGLIPTKNVQYIDKVELTVVAPAVGKTPTFAKVNTTTYESKNLDPKPTNQANGCNWANTATGTFLSVSNLFKAGVDYTVTYSLFPKDGYAFASNVTATINGQTATVTQRDGYILVTLSGFVPTKKTITPITITGVTEPKAGKTPNYTINVSGDKFKVEGANNENWTNGVAWVEFVPGASSGRVMKKTDTFKAGNKYAIYIDVASTDEGYGFVKNETVATINGKTATVNPDDSTARVLYTFPALSQLTLSKVELNVVAPAAGEKPSYDKINATGFSSDNNGNAPAVYKNGIAWFKSATAHMTAGSTETFEAGKDYTLKICLVAKENYAFSKTLTATINGKAATVTVNDDGSVHLEIVLSTPAAPHTHTPSGWQTDDGYHWRVCTDTACGSIVSAKQMHLNTDADGKCDICGYQLPVEVPDDPTDPPVVDPTVPPVDNPTDPPVDDPTDPPVDDPTDPPVDDPTEPVPTTPVSDQSDVAASNSGLIWIILGAAGVVLAGVVVLLLIKKKK